MRKLPPNPPSRNRPASLCHPELRRRRGTSQWQPRLFSAGTFPYYGKRLGARSAPARSLAVCAARDDSALCARGVPQNLPIIRHENLVPHHPHSHRAGGRGVSLCSLDPRAPDAHAHDHAEANAGRRLRAPDRSAKFPEVESQHGEDRNASAGRRERSDAPDLQRQYANDDHHQRKHASETSRPFDGRHRRARSKDRGLTKFRRRRTALRSS